MTAVSVTKKSRAKIRTSMGDIVLEFLPEKAPRTVENFLILAHKGFYEGLTFHRVVKDFVIQGGCPKGDGSGGPGYTIRPEFNDTPHVRGTVSMARSSDPHSAGSQFFICHGDARYLDSRYAAFARVVEGMEVLDKIAAVPVNEEPRHREVSRPRDPVYINGVDLVNVRFEEEAPPAPAPAQPSAAPGTGADEEAGEVEDDGPQAKEGEQEEATAEGSASSGSRGRRGRSGSRGRSSRSRRKDGGKDDKNGKDEE